MERLGKYEIISETGSDHLGTIYRARDTELGRDVTLRVLDPALTSDPGSADRIIRQARALARLNHPHLVAVLDAGEAEGRVYIATAPVEGPTLAVALARSGLPPRARALEILKQVSGALDYAHRQGVVHGDLRPENILLDPRGSAMVANLGAARLAGATGAGESPYAAPEVREGTEASPASDLYALGRLAQEMLGDLQPEASAVLGWALAAEPAARPPSAAAYLDALSQSILGSAGVTTPAATDALAGAAPAPESSPPKRQRGGVACGLIAGGILLALALVMTFNSLRKELSYREVQRERASTQTAVARATKTAGPGVTATAVVWATRAAGLAEEAIAAGPVLVPAGEFLMGSPDAVDEKPQRAVYIDAYRIDRVEVTNAMYAKCVDAGACKQPSDFSSSTRAGYYGNRQFGNYPVIHVTWEDARAYCAWSGGRVPTEAEWEKAARGTDGRLYPWGDEPPDAQRSNFARVGDTTPVGGYPSGASPYGALDMAGNVREWTADWYGSDYYGFAPDRNPQGPETGTNRVVRGGGWRNDAVRVRAAFRGASNPKIGDDSIGFRCIYPP